jgi:hypothetical protein
MAVYKVPQDVEADDKLIGPFSFRQFIYLIVVAIAMAGSWGLSQLFIPLAIIPLPVIVFFAALALPLRKDQPMEAYLTAVVSFYFLKSRKRFWIPDGIDSFVTIIPPKDADRILTNELNEDEATKRLNYLAQLVDTHGWAIRGAGATPDTSISTDLYFESQQAPDMMDSTSDSAKALSKQLNEKAGEEKKEAIDAMKAAAKQPAATTTTPGEPPQSRLVPQETKARGAVRSHVSDQREEMDRRDAITYANMMTEMISEERGAPAAESTKETTSNTSVSTPDTDTMELTREQASEIAAHTEETVSTIAQEAKHVAEQNKALKNGDEVTISIRHHH